MCCLLDRRFYSSARRHCYHEASRLLLGSSVSRDLSSCLPSRLSFVDLTLINSFLSNRVLNRIYAAIMAQASAGGIKGGSPFCLFPLFVSLELTISPLSRKPPQPRHQDQDCQLPSYGSLHPRCLRSSDLLEIASFARRTSRLPFLW